MLSEDTAPNPIQSLPSASTVHRRISVLVREERFLRRLLKLIVASEQLVNSPANPPRKEGVRG
jgi:hypothetical protein